MRLSADIGADARIDIGHGPSLVLSPDGAKLAFVASGSDQTRRIYVRSLDELQATALSGTEDAETAIFLARWPMARFLRRPQIEKDIRGRRRRRDHLRCSLSAAAQAGAKTEPSCSCPAARTALSEVSSGGGAPRPLTILDQRAAEVSQVWPQWLPGGKAVLFTSVVDKRANFEDADIVAYTISSGQRKTVLHGGYYARYVRSGHILYMHEGTLFLVPFDPRSLEVTGTPVPVHRGHFRKSR